MQNRERLLRAAVELFGEQGYAETSVEDLLQATGVARSNFYYHFDGREGLARELVGEWAEETEAALRRAAADGSDDPRRGVRRVFALSRPGEGESAVVASVALQRAPFDEDVRAAVGSLLDEVERSLADAVGGGGEDGSRTRTAARLGALAVLGAIDLERAFPGSEAAAAAEEAFLAIAGSSGDGVAAEPLAAAGPRL